MIKWPSLAKQSREGSATGVHDNLYFNKDIQKTTFGCFEIRMARAGIVKSRGLRGVEVQLYIYLYVGFEKGKHTAIKSTFI